MMTQAAGSRTEGYYWNILFAGAAMFAVCYVAMGPAMVVFSAIMSSCMYIAASLWLGVFDFGAVSLPNGKPYGVTSAHKLVMAVAPALHKTLCVVTMLTLFRASQALLPAS